MLKYNAFSDRPATLELGYCVYKDFRPLIAGLNGSRFHSVFGIQLRRSFRRSLTRYIWLPLSNRTFYASGKQSDKFALLIMLIRPYFKLFSPVSSLVCMYAAKIKITHLWVTLSTIPPCVSLLNYISCLDQPVSLGVYYHI